MTIRLLNCLTFVPWILYFIEIMYYRIACIENNRLSKKKYLNNLNKNLFTTINIKEIALFIIFILFMQKDNIKVQSILFMTIYLYMLIDFFHSLAYYCKKIKYKRLMVLTVILTVGIVGFYLYTNKIYTTYILMFGVSILNAFIIYIFSYITRILKK